MNHQSAQGAGPTAGLARHHCGDDRADLDLAAPGKLELHLLLRYWCVLEKLDGGYRLGPPPHGRLEGGDRLGPPGGRLPSRIMGLLGWRGRLADVLALGRLRLLGGVNAAFEFVS